MANFDDQAVTFGDYADDEKQGDGLTRLQWRQGDPRAKTGGYFFLSRKNVPEGFAPAGNTWTAHEEYFERTRTRDSGWKAEALPMMIICVRSQPFVRPPEGSGQPKRWLEKWDTAQDCAQHADVLLIADGLQALGPVCWSTNSSTIAFAVITGPDPKRTPRGGICHRIREEVLGTADKLSKTMQSRKAKKLYWLFWITIASQVDDKGAVVFTPTVGKDVTLPVARLPETIDAPWLISAYVGNELAAYGEETRSGYDVWRRARFANDVAPAETTASRNIPQPTEADLIPF